MCLERAVIHRRVQEPRAIRAMVGIGQDREPREVNRAALRKSDVRAPARWKVRTVDVVTDRTKHGAKRVHVLRLDRNEDGQAIGWHALCYDLIITLDALHLATASIRRDRMGPLPTMSTHGSAPWPLPPEPLDSVRSI